MIVQCATFSESLNPRNIDECVSDIRIRIRFPFESSFWISGPVANSLSCRISNRQTGSWSSLLPCCRNEQCFQRFHRVRWP